MRNQAFHYFLILFVAFFSMAAHANPQDVAKESQENPLAFSSCEPLVRIYGDVICRSDIEQVPEHESEIKKAYKENGIDPAQAIQRENRQRLYNKIWNRALDNHFSQDLIEPSADILSAYHEGFKNALAQNYERDKRMIAQIDQKLKSENLNDEQRASLQDLKDITLVSTAYYEKNKEFRDNLPPEMESVMQEAERELVMTQLRGFYEDKALYNEFGGALYMVEDFPKPLAAYRKFLMSLDNKPEIEIIAPEYQDLLQDMAQNFEALLNDMAPLPNEKTDGFYNDPMIMLDREEMENLTSQ